MATIKTLFFTYHHMCLATGHLRLTLVTCSLCFMV